MAFEHTNIIQDVVRHLRNDDIKLKENCALTIFKSGPNKVARDIVRETNGLDILCKLVQNEDVRANKPLLAAVTGAIWKCAISPENVVRFNQNGLVPSLVPLLEDRSGERRGTCRHPRL